MSALADVFSLVPLFLEESWTLVFLFDVEEESESCDMTWAMEVIKEKIKIL